MRAAGFSLKLGLALLAILAAGGCVDRTPAPQSPSQGSTGTEYFLHDAELRRLQGFARSGDASAAVRVADHYALGLNDPRSSLEWRRLAAQYGSVTAMRDMASDLVSASQTKASCAEAKMWIGRAGKLASAEQSRTLDLASVRLIVDQRCTDIRIPVQQNPVAETGLLFSPNLAHASATMHQGETAGGRAK